MGKDGKKMDIKGKERKREQREGNKEQIMCRIRDYKIFLCLFFFFFFNVDFLRKSSVWDVKFYLGLHQESLFLNLLQSIIQLSLADYLP